MDGERERLLEMAEEAWTQAMDADRAGDEAMAEEYREEARQLERRAEDEN